MRTSSRPTSARIRRRDRHPRFPRFIVKLRNYEPRWRGFAGSPISGAPYSTITYFIVLCKGVSSRSLPASPAPAKVHRHPRVHNRELDSVQLGVFSVKELKELMQSWMK